MTGSAWKLPGYVIERRLGVGGSGQVWRARERVSGEAVAVKLLPAVGRDQLATVRSEAAMLSALDHPHLLHLHEVLSCKQGLALVVDLAAGGSLASLLGSRGRLSPGEVVTAVAPIGAALAYAHNAGVVHGDVSPANLLFTGVGRPLLADLGVARLSGDDWPVSSTPAYVDPAVAAGGVPAPASDVFMLGAVALHALTGEPPWPGRTPAGVLAAAAAGDIGDVLARMSAAVVPGPVAEVVSRALDLDPGRRPTAAEFALDLRHAAEPVAVELGAGRLPGEPAEDRAPFTHLLAPWPRRPLPSRHRARLSRPRRLSVVAAGTVAALAVVAALLGAVRLWPRGADHVLGPAGQVPSTTPIGTTPRTGGSSTSSTPAPSTAGPGASTMTPAAAGQVLVILDAVRSRAFARRDPTLLARVYASGPLRSQDTALIAKIIPEGCGLVGVRTDYTEIAVIARTKIGVVLRVEARLRPSVLECSRTPSASAPGAPSSGLNIVLVRSGDHYLIGAITR